MDGLIDGALAVMDRVDTLDDVALVSVNTQVIRDENATQDEDAVLDFHLASRLADELFLPGRNPARLQRATKGPD